MSLEEFSQPHEKENECDSQIQDQSHINRDKQCTTCIFHSVRCRGRFEHVMNASSQEGLVPRKHLRQIGRIICACYTAQHLVDLDDLIHEEEYITLQLPSKSDLLDELATNAPKVSAALKSLSDVKFAVGMDQDTYNKGMKRLLYILHMAIRKNYSSLEHPGVTYSVPVLKKFPHEFEFIVEFPRSYLGVLIGSKGKNLKLLSKQNNCEIRVQRDRMNMSNDQVKFHVRTEIDDDKVKVETIVRDLLDNIVKKREAHALKVLAFRAMKRQRRLANQQSRSSAADTSSDSALDIKDDAKDHYSTKYQHMLKNKSARKMEKAHPKASILEEGKSFCANCMIPYDKDLPNTPESCKYHKGFLSGSRFFKRNWSCCRTAFVEKGPLATSQSESHAQDGCTSGLHNWRPHKKTSVSKNHENSSTAKHAWSDMKTQAGSSLAKHVANMSMHGDFPAV